MSFTVISTIGPSLMENHERLISISKLGNIIFRINGAHADKEKAEEITRWVRSHLPQAKIMIDLPGNKIRTANLTKPIPLVAGELFAIEAKNLNYSDFYKHLKKGDEIYANDSIYHLEVDHIEGSKIVFKSYSNGQLQTNKGLNFPRVSDSLPFFFQRDLELAMTAVEMDIDYLSLSFVRHAEDVQYVKKILKDHSDKKLKIIAKIETKSALENLDSILPEVEMINVDRGDLSNEIGLINLAHAQEKIITKGLSSGKKVFLATQFLRSMEKKSLPYIAEMVDLCKSINQGISGIQLSEETAVGDFPVECVDLVFKVYRDYKN